MNGLAAILSLVLFLTTDFSNTQTVVPPPGNHQKVVYPAKPGAPNPVFQAMGTGVNSVGKGLGNAAQGAAQGAGWFFGELLRPVEALRVGMIDMFGVKEESGRKHR